jgi:predicted AlkP superfamily pyrophosphatase or phosphodiesterase
MKQLTAITLIAAACCYGQNAGGKPARHLVLISVDGMRPVEYQRESSYVPGIRAMAQAGCAATGAVPVFPTVTYPNHTAIVTGQPPAVHGIVSNNIFDPFNQTSGGWYWYAEQIRTPALWQVVKSGGGTTASVGWPVTVGADIDYLIPEYRNVRHADDVALMRALSTPGLIRDIEKALGKVEPQNAHDEWKAAAAGFIFEKYKPTLTLLHLTELDHEQHLAGTDSPEAVASLKHLDSVIAKLKKQVESAAAGAPVTWIIVSDHGFQKIEKQFNPKVAVRNLGYVSYTRQGALDSWRVFPRSAGGAFALVAKDSSDGEAIDRTRRYFEFLSKDPQIGIRRLYSREELKNMRAFPDAFLAGDMIEGFTVGDNPDGMLISDTSNKGMHGYDPENPNMQASFLVSGAGAARCGVLEKARLVDVAPTAAAILGLKFPESAGRVQSGAIR